MEKVRVEVTEENKDQVLPLADNVTHLVWRIEDPLPDPLPPKLFSLNAPMAKEIPPLPTTVRVLFCPKAIRLPDSLPPNLLDLECQDATNPPTRLHKGMRFFVNNHIKHLDEIPEGMEHITCGSIEVVPPLPSTIKRARFKSAKIMPELPQGTILADFPNATEFIGVFPVGLKHLTLGIEVLSGPLPPNLKSLKLPHLKQVLVEFPLGIEVLYLGKIKIITFSIPHTVKVLVCNYVKDLPQLHEGLKTLFCRRVKIIEQLPNTLEVILASGAVSLPEPLPETLTTIFTSQELVDYLKDKVGEHVKLHVV